MVVTDILYSLANDAAVRFSGGSSFLRIVFRIWALYRAIGHLLFHLVLGDNYYGRARLPINKIERVICHHFTVALFNLNILKAVP